MRAAGQWVELAYSRKGPAGLHPAACEALATYVAVRLADKSAVFATSRFLARMAASHSFCRFAVAF